MAYLRYFPLQKEHKSITGAVPQGTPVHFYVQSDARECVLLVREDGADFSTEYAMERVEDGFQVSFLPKETGLFFYSFKADSRFYGLDETTYGAKMGGREFLLTVHLANFTTPEKWKGGIMYQIFPDRFAREGEARVDGKKILREDWGGTPTYEPVNGKVLNNDFFGGNVQGILSKLEYLTSLGVTSIYLNPIFKAASNHRYDTSDYSQIDPTFGSEQEFESFLQECKKRGISVILDGVFNHTGDDSIYFNKYGTHETLGAYQSKKSPYYDWYDFLIYPNKYEAWWGIDILPAVNDSRESFREYIAGENGILAKWQRLGVDGWRLDVADELSDSFIRVIRSRIKKEDDQALLIGEVWEEADEKVAYNVRRAYLQGAELDSVMNYPLKNAILRTARYGDFSHVYGVMRKLVDRYPKCVLDVLMNSLSTHDTNRVLTELSGVCIQCKSVRADYKMKAQQRELARSREKVAAALQFFLPGIPCIYYGDEIGMEGYEDPFNRRCFPKDGKGDEELLSYYRTLARIRREIPLFKTGEYIPVKETHGVYVFARVEGEDAVIIALNGGDAPYGVDFKKPVKEWISGEISTHHTVKRNSVSVFYRK
ncbi:MAG: glycoside hydrolase family 13 protein [Clostridiales bacterium]|nr:glycoside hydrolase family 13 protein [Clostridiales bacterium]